jgi:cyclophilin family peptidyl-prolyl cis-trans isomerase
VRKRYFDEGRFFRVVPGFIAQFGVHRDFQPACHLAPVAHTGRSAEKRKISVFTALANYSSPSHHALARNASDDRRPRALRWH